MNDKFLEELLNETFTGLALFYRDTTLAPELASKYKPGQIIMERGFTDMTHLGGGMSGNFRYLVASSKGKDLSAFNPEAATFGHVFLQSNACFKVLDIAINGNKTQVLLLHIPERGITAFKTTIPHIEEYMEFMIKLARKNFEENLTLPALEALQSHEWKERVSFPIGMNNTGELFYQEN